MNLLAVAVLVSALADPAHGTADHCSLLDSKELAKLQSAQVAETKESVRSERGFEVRQCFFRLDPFSRSVSLEVTRQVSSNAARQGLRERWAAIFHEEPRREERDKEGEREEKSREKPVPVSGLGEEAFWLPNPASGALYVLARDRYFRVSVGGGDRPEKKLAKCRSIAESILARLPKPE